VRTAFNSVRYWPSDTVRHHLLGAIFFNTSEFSTSDAPGLPKMSGLATKQQSLKIFEKLKSKPANKVNTSGNTSESRLITDSFGVAMF
jgi:hypothetical protein